MGFDFLLNGERVEVTEASPTTTLLQFLRARGSTGSKEGCAEGDCGACTVLLLEKDTAGKTTYRAINSCIALLPMVAGREVVTVEGVGMYGEHPVQASMVRHYGSQCGYCTPGFVCSMFEGYYRGNLDPSHINDQLQGNLCRCTGYRPIRDAMLEALETKNSAKDDLFQVRLGKDLPPPSSLDHQANGKRFVRPTTLAALLDLRATHPEAALIAGATEIGVEINKKASPYPFLISTEGIDELTRVAEAPDAWHIGGAATLTAIEEKIGPEFPAVQKMLSVFASRQIRSRATLAGNLVTASPIGDMAPVLLVLGASVELTSKARGARVVPLTEFFLAYRKTALLPDEVMTKIVLPRGAPASTRRKTDSFKVSKRRELDISIVAAAFSVDLDENDIVRAARLAYGGVAATPVRARKTEAFLAGKPWSSSTVAGASEILAQEFSPIRDVRSGPDFRRGLTVSLFEKFFDGESSASQDAPLSFERSTPWSIDTTKADAPSFALAHESGRGHVSGEAEYVDDQAHKRAMLEMWPVVSPHAHARIVRIDTSRAERMPGVACVLTAKDVPGENDVGAIRKDESLLAHGDVRFHGHIVAVVVGDSYEVCRRAAALVEVDYEPLPQVLSAREAAEKQSFHTMTHVIARGDAASALAHAPHRISGELDIGGQEHFYLESQAAWAECDDSGGVRVVSSTQHPSEVQAVVSHVLHLPRNQVVVEAPRMGGGFGGKETQGNTWAGLVALAAKKTRRPVRVQLDRDVDMMLTGKRHPFFARYDAGYDDEGHILAARVDLVSDGGWALDLSESISDRALFHLDNCYFIPNVRFSGRVGKTNNVSHTAFRGFGGPQGMVVIEEIVDRIARNLGKKPEIVRHANFYKGTGETNTTHYGELLDDNRIDRIWHALLTRSDFEKRRQAIHLANTKRDRIKRGIAITPVKFGISFTASFLNQAGALVIVYRDGTVQVNHGGTEMGQGLYTKMLGVAMRELGLSAEKIRVMKTVTDKVPNTSATAASSGADLNGAAVRNACEILRMRLADIALDIWGKTAVDPACVRFANGRVFLEESPEFSILFTTLADQAHLRQVQLSATGFYRTPAIRYDRILGRGKPFHYFAYGAAVTEVEVDGYSGMKRVVRVDIVHDVGDSLNYGVDRGQIEGGFVQGMGWLTGEELLWDDRGRLLTHSASTYQIPSIGDAPEAFHVELLGDATQKNVVHGSKAVGEPPLMLAISVREAIREAVAAFGAPGGEVPLGCPSTHEAIFAAIQARLFRKAGAANAAAE